MSAWHTLSLIKHELSKDVRVSRFTRLHGPDECTVGSALSAMTATSRRPELPARGGGILLSYHKQVPEKPAAKGLLEAALI